MPNDITTTPALPAAGRATFSLSPTTLQEAIQFADMLSKSNMVPKDFVGNAGNIIVAIQWGAEIGLAPLQAMQNIAVINGRPSLWGDAVLGLVRASGLLESISEEVDASGATCTVKRKGQVAITRTFTMEDAKRAGLATKPGPWTQYPKRMLQLRARSYALRDEFTDVLKGIQTTEILRDEIDITPESIGNTQLPPPKPKASPSPYPDDKFAVNLPKWAQYVQAGKKTPADIIATVTSKNTLTDAQVAAINALAPAPAASQADDDGVVMGPADAQRGGDDDFLADMERAEGGK